MELVVALLAAGPLGYFVRPSRRALRIYLIVWAAVFPVQWIVVRAATPDSIEPAYFAVNAAILAFGVGLHRLGVLLRQRKVARATG